MLKPYKHNVVSWLAAFRNVAENKLISSNIIQRSHLEF